MMLKLTVRFLTSILLPTSFFTTLLLHHRAKILQPKCTLSIRARSPWPFNINRHATPPFLEGHSTQPLWKHIFRILSVCILRQATLSQRTKCKIDFSNSSTQKMGPLLPNWSLKLDCFHLRSSPLVSTTLI